MKFPLGERVVESLNKTKGKCTLTLYNISYDAKEQDIKNHFYGIKIAFIEKITRGTFYVEFENAEEAIKCVNFKDNVIYFCISFFPTFLILFRC